MKREDLSWPAPGPAFSKMRGVYAHLAKRPEKVIGVLDTYHSQAGHGVAHVCSILGKTAVNFFPKYKADGDDIRETQRRARDLGAELVPLPAGRSAILYHAARKQTEARGGYMMPNALKLPETVEETAREVGRTLRRPDFPADVQRVLISASSGTIAAGLLRGLGQAGSVLRVVVHMGYDRSEAALREYLETRSGYPLDRVERIVNEGWAYKDPARPAPASPFPCNPYYDLKAYQWWVAQGYPKGYMLWNIG